MKFKVKSKKYKVKSKELREESAYVKRKKRADSRCGCSPLVCWNGIFV